MIRSECQRASENGAIRFAENNNSGRFAGKNLSFTYGHLKDHKTKPHPDPTKMRSNHVEISGPSGNLVLGRQAISNFEQIGKVGASREWTVGMDKASRDGRD